MDFSRFDPTSFEQMIRALALETLGVSVSVFGDGPDGGREASWSGSFPQTKPPGVGHGYGVIQAKFKQNQEGVRKDNEWVLRCLRDELALWRQSATRTPKPDFLILCT